MAPSPDSSNGQSADRELQTPRSYNGARTSVLIAAIAHASINLAPEPWAAAWQQLPESVRGPYPSVLIALAWVAVVLVLVLVGAARTRGGRVRAGL
jgi:hypothetical protein